MAQTRTGQVGSLIGGIAARLLLFFVVVALVWVTFVWLYALHPDLLGWVYATLRPITIWFYSLVDTRLPDAVKYKVSAGLSDELGPRALLLLILGGVIEALILGLWRGIGLLARVGRK